MVSWLTAIGAGVLVVATYGGYHGLRWVGRYVRFTRAPTSATGQVRSPGLVEVSGTVDADPPFESPVAGEECVLAKWSVEEWHESNRGSHWKTVDTGVYAVPFEVDDGSGPVTVDLRDRAADGTVAARWPDFLDGGGRVDPDVVTLLDDVEVAATREPGAVSGRLKRLQTIENLRSPNTALIPALDVGRQKGERRYAEHVVRPGEEVTVVGEASVEGAGPRGPTDATIRPRGRAPLVDMDVPLNLTLYPPTRDEPFVAEGAPAAVAAHARNRTLLVPWALALVALGAWTALDPAVPVGPSPTASLLAAAVLLGVGGAAAWRP